MSYPDMMHDVIKLEPISFARLPVVVANILHPSPRHIDGCISFHFTAPLWLKALLAEWVMCLCIAWACSIFYFGCGWSIGQREVRCMWEYKERNKCFVPLCLSVWQLVELSGRLLCFPLLLKLGMAGLGCWAGERRTLRGFGSTLIRVIITAGTHTHTHQRWYLLLASVRTPMVSSGQRW